MGTVLITGANGFVGIPLCQRLAAAGWRVLGGVRSRSAELQLPSGTAPRRIPDVRAAGDWAPCLEGVDTIVHLVARTHVMADRGGQADQDYHCVNVTGTRRLAAAAVRAGVSRFVFMSSIKAVGEGSSEAYTETSPHRPTDAYGISKLAAERELACLAGNAGMAFLIIRPPLIYGRQVRGNLRRLLRLTRRNWPLPFASISNARSLVYVRNLADAVATVLASRARNEVFHVADSTPLSTPELLRSLARAQGRQARLFPFPVSFLKLAGQLTRRTAEIDRLVGSLTVSTEKIRRELGWAPPFGTEEGLHEMALDRGPNIEEHAPPQQTASMQAASRVA